MDVGPAEQLASFCAAVDCALMPTEVVERCRLVLLDYLACAVIGSSREHVRRAARLLAEREPGAAGAVGLPGRFTRRDAAWLNGLSGTSAPNLDDVWHASLGHPGVGTVPAALVTAAERHASGAQLAGGVVAGYEAAMRVGAGIGRRAYRVGWHPRGGCNAIGAAVAVAHVQGVRDPARMLATMGHAANAAGGLVQASYFYDAWYVLSADAADAGMRAADLAMLGYSVAPDAIDGPRGYGPIVSDEWDASKLFNGLGEPYLILRAGQKLYPTSGATHAAIEAALDIAARPGFDFGQVRSVEIRGFRELVESLSVPFPHETVHASMSAPYLVAAALRDGRVDLNTLEAANRDDPQIKQLQQQTTTIVDPELEALAPDRLAAAVEVTLDHGGTLSAKVLCARGHDGQPLTAAEVEGKFRRAATGRLPSRNIDDVVAWVDDLPSRADCNELVELVCGDQ